MDLFIAYEPDQGHYLVASRGMTKLMHPNAVTALERAGIPVAQVDVGTLNNLKATFDKAP